MSRLILPKVAAAIAFFAAFTVTADARVDVHIDKSAQRMYVAVDGVTRYVWPVSTGAAGYDTPSGEFTPFRMERKHFSQEWDNAPMPYSIFFTTEGHAIHGSSHTRSLGRPASHGCVRLAPRHAAKLFELVSRNGLQDASITVSGAYASLPAPASSAAPQISGDVAGAYPPVAAPPAGAVAGTDPPAAPQLAGEVVETTTVY